MTGPAGNVYDKYGTKNPVARFLVSRHHAALREFLAAAAPSSLLEIGCGEGHLAALMREWLPGCRVEGSDVSPEIVDLARGLHPEILFSVEDAAAMRRAPGSFAMVVASEVFEHVPDPDAVLAGVAKVTSRWMLAGVPREPIWRVANLARGKYLLRLGNTPGHIRHWSSRGFERFLARRLRVVAVRRPFPWTVALCEKR